MKKLMSTQMLNKKIKMNVLNHQKKILKKMKIKKFTKYKLNRVIFKLLN